MELFMWVMPIAIVISIFYWLTKVSKAFSRSEYSNKSNDKKDSSSD